MSRLINAALHLNGTHFRPVYDAKHPLHHTIAANLVWHCLMDPEALKKFTAKLKAINPNCRVGLYRNLLATTRDKDYVIPAKFPIEYCSPEMLLGPWPQPQFEHVKFVDLRKASVRQALIHSAIALAKDLGLDVLCFDNGIYGMKYCPAYPVDEPILRLAYRRFVMEASDAAHDFNLKVAFNIATPADRIIDAFAVMAPYADYLLTEAGFHANCSRPEQVAFELKGYGDLLARYPHLSIVVIPARPKTEPTGFQFERRSLRLLRPLAATFPGRLLCSAAGPMHADPLYDLDFLDPDPDGSRSLT